MGDKGTSKGMAKMIITLGVAVALLCNFGDAWTSRRIEESSLQMANAAPERENQGETDQLSDPLLVVVNETIALPEDWEFFPFLVDDEVVDRRMAKDLLQMVKAAEQDGVWLWVASGYRSRERQQFLFQKAVEENERQGMGEEEARASAMKTLALPGHSEHETGLAVDFNDVSGEFANTKAYDWLQQNGPKYGFVQRYREEKRFITGVEEESWHYRYVGKEAAQEMEQLHMCLEEYVQYQKERQEG